MKFICDRRELCKAIASLSKAIAKNPILKVLEGIRIQWDSFYSKKVSLCGYDMELGIQANVPALTEGDGDFVVSYQMFSKVLKKMAGNEVTIDVSEESAVIQCGSTEFSIPAMAVEDYPTLPSFEDGETFFIEQGKLRSMIQQTSYATFKGEDKPVYTGELFEIDDNELKVVAMDGYRLAVRTEKVSSEFSKKIVVPKRILETVASMIKKGDESLCNVTVTNSNIVFSVNGYFIFSYLLEGEFFNYKGAIPYSHETEVILNTADLISCLNRCSLLDEKNGFTRVDCKFSNNQLHVRSQTSIGKIHDVLPVQMNGNEVFISLNKQYLLETVKAADCEQIRIQLTGYKTPAKILPVQGNDFIFLVMPVQASK